LVLLDFAEPTTYAVAQSQPSPWLAITIQRNPDSSSPGSRKRRATGKENEIKFTLGKQPNCASPSDPKVPCNMPLKSGTEYR